MAQCVGDCAGMRHVIYLITGLVIGVAGAVLVRDSLPPAAGTAEARLLEVEKELKDTRLRLAKIDPAQARPREDSTHALGRGMRLAMEDMKAGRPVDPNVLFDAIKPLMRDFFPLFDNLRRRDERRRFESLAGEYGRKYNLTAGQQEELKRWMEDRSESNAAAFKAAAFGEQSRFADFAKASRGQRWDDGIDGFMEGQLSGEKLTTYRRERLEEKAGRVEQEADWKMQRLNATVGLDEAQQDQVFGIMARNARDFDPQMQIEGVTGEAAPGGDREAAIEAVLRPEQRAAYGQWKEQRRASAAREFEEIGMKLPDGWDALEED